MKPNWNKPVLDKRLFDGIGNYCRVEVFQMSSGKVEVWFHDFNDALPRRFIGSPGNAQLEVDLWLDRQQSGGWKEKN